MADKAARKPFEPSQMVGPYLAERCVEHGLILRNVENTLAFCPPLIIEPEQIDRMMERFGRALDATQAWVEKG